MCVRVCTSVCCARVCECMGGRVLYKILNFFSELSVSQCDRAPVPQGGGRGRSDRPERGQQFEAPAPWLCHVDK